MAARLERLLQLHYDACARQHTNNTAEAAAALVSIYPQSFVCLIQSGYSRLPYEPSLESDLAYKRNSLPSLMNESDPSLWLPT
jgi:hypothetical protein